MVRDYHTQRVSPHARKEENKEIQNLSENDEKIKLAKQAKQDNLAIGDLESRLKSLKGMDKDAKELVGISKAYAQACKEAKVYGVFSIMERNPDSNKNPYNTAIIIDPQGEIILKYRKLFPWNPIEPWYPGDLGMPVCEGPGGSKLAVCICHDGMIPELAREAAYKGCNVYIRISGYSTQVNDQWILTNRSNAWHNLMYTVSVNLAGYDNVFYYFGEGQICNFDGTTLVQGHRNPWEIVTGEIYPKMADNARLSWGLENNIYNLGHRGYVAKPGGEHDAGLTYIKDLAAGKYKLPWEDHMKIKDGSIYGYPTTGGRFGK